VEGRGGEGRGGEGRLTCTKYKYTHLEQSTEYYNTAAAHSNRDTATAQQQHSNSTARLTAQKNK
jgi:hypothetical protein